MSSVFSSWKNLRRTPYQSLTALFVVIVTFFIIYVFATFLFVGQQVLTYFETRPQILVFFDSKVTDSEATASAQLIQQLDYVQEVKIIGKTQAFSNYQAENQDEPLLLELLSADLFPASLSITATSPDGLDKIRTEIEKINGIDEVDFRQDVIDQFLSWTSLARNIGLAACVLFIALFVLVIIVITSMKVAGRRRSINIMSILGAGRSKIRGTFIREGMWLGLCGSLIAFGLSYLLIYSLTPAATNFLGEIEVFPLPWEFYLLAAASGSLAAVLLAGFSAWVAVSRLIKK